MADATTRAGNDRDLIFKSHKVRSLSSRSGDLKSPFTVATPLCRRLESCLLAEQDYGDRAPSLQLEV
jgi:hypothetical protein